MEPHNLFQHSWRCRDIPRAAVGWRIIKTLGHKMVKLHPINGFAPETSSPLRVIMLTGSARGEDVNRAYRMGANSYITKPVGASGLVDILGAMGTHWLQHSKVPDLKAFPA